MHFKWESFNGSCEFDEAPENVSKHKAHFSIHKKDTLIEILQNVHNQKYYVYLCSSLKNPYFVLKDGITIRPYNYFSLSVEYFSMILKIVDMMNLFCDCFDVPKLKYIYNMCRYIYFV